MEEQIIEVARKLAAMHAENEPAITEIYLFPDDEEIRLVDVDPTTIPNEGNITPYCFPPDPQSGIPYCSCIALILPEEKERVGLPEKWGEWSSAILLYQKITTPEQNYIDFMYRLHDIAIDLVKTLSFDKTHVWHRSLMSLYGTILELFNSTCILVREALNLKSSAIALPILLRSSLEAYVDFLLLAKDRNYCDNLRAVELDQWIRVLLEAKKNQNPILLGISGEPDLDQRINDDQNELANLKMKKVELLSQKQKFEKAGLLDLYFSLYNFLCCESHNNIRALQSRHIKISEDETDFEVECFSPFKIMDHLGTLDVFCDIVISASKHVHEILNSSAKSRIESLKIELAECRNKLGNMQQ